MKKQIPSIYSAWKIYSLCGATPQFGFASFRAISDSHPPRKDEPMLWRASLTVMRRLATGNGCLTAWLNHAERVESLRDIHDPFAIWHLALLESSEVPGYPMQVSYREDETVCIDCACPYQAAQRSSLQLTCEFLGWSHALLRSGRVTLPSERLKAWLRAFEGLPALLPTRELMVFHRELWKRGIGWDWLGDRRTRVGHGVKQKIFQSPPVSIGDSDSFRIPIYTVTGSIGKTTTARLLVQLLRHSGRKLAFTASDGAWIGEERVLEGDCIGGVSAQGLLKRPDVEGAVFEQGRGGIINQGIPYAHSDVAVLLNVQEVHLGLNNIRTVGDMADVKACGLKPARLAVLNLDDNQCRRIGNQRAAESCVWFSVSASSKTVRETSRTSAGSLGVERNANGEPLNLLVCEGGHETKRLSLENVRPYHGLLGEKTLEELLAAVGSAWFGPLPVADWDAVLPMLRLDNSNHLFRTSIHRRGDVVYVLDKAGEISSLKTLGETIEFICREEGIIHRIAVLSRTTVELPARHKESCNELYRFMDEFICFDRPETYQLKAALPCYSPGVIPKLLQEEFLRLNAVCGGHKPVSIADGWDVAERMVLDRLSAISGKTLVLINQPSTGAVALNNSIISFVTSEITEGGGTEREDCGF